MKRILFALLLAMTLYVGLLLVDFGMFFDDTVIRPRLTAVTVTMSSRRPEPVIEARKKPPEPPEVKYREKPKTPEKKITPPKVPENIPVEKLEAPETPDEEPTQDPRETTDVNDDEDRDDKTEEIALMENNQEDDSSNKRVVRKTVPLIREQTRPRYPPVAIRRGYQGTVVVSFTINENGRVENLLVAESSGHRILDRAAIKAVRGWVFNSQSQSNKDVNTLFEVPVTFQLHLK